MDTPAKPITIGAVLFPGFEILDVYGPLEMFGMLGERARITMLAERPGPVRTLAGPAGLADASLAETGDLDVLLVPGGMGTRREVGNAAFIGELARLCARAGRVASVCTGSALLARAGVLDGRRATSNKRAFAWVRSQGPAVDWVPRARWVEDGRFFTASGVSAGIDMSLGLIASIFGRQASLEIATWAEYEWHEDSGWDPFASLNGLA